MTSNTREAVAAICRADSTITPEQLKEALAALSGQARGTNAKPAAVEQAFVTYPKAATMTGLSRMTVYRLVKAGEISVAPVRGKNRVVRESVIAFIRRAKAT